ncbi:MAG: hypothetical protein IH624_02675 [Phycisphaerae bacterium]|nr:hypothetical protein [Phycisphaerae bacterium]
MNKHICTAALAAAALLALLPGCTTYDDKKHAARTKWDKVSAQARVTVARDLFENGRYEDARITAQQCLQTDPELPPGVTSPIQSPISTRRQSSQSPIELPTRP